MKTEYTATKNKDFKVDMSNHMKTLFFNDAKDFMNDLNLNEFFVETVNDVLQTECDRLYNVHLNNGDLSKVVDNIQKRKSNVGAPDWFIITMSDGSKYVKLNDHGIEDITGVVLTGF